MNERNYLLNVLAVSSIPRIVSFVMKLISYPLMVRSVGAQQLGVVVYISAVIVILESFVDFGASSAAGKDVAVAREKGLLPPLLIIKKWAKFQFLVACIGLPPFGVATYLLSEVRSSIAIESDVIILLLLSVWLTIFINYLRAVLTAMLAFKALALFDLVESLLRSILWLCVALLMPTAMGLAMSNLITAVLSLTFGITILTRLSKRNWALETDQVNNIPEMSKSLNTSIMIKKSLSFLWLRAASRLFTSIPLMFFGRMFGSELVGIIGGFSRIMVLCNFPFGVIGNALAVRAPGIVMKGLSHSITLWNVVYRVISFSFILAGSVYLGSGYLAQLLFPNDPLASSIVGLLSIIVITDTVAATVTPISDYIGSLRARNVLLSFFAVLQIPFLWVGAIAFEEKGAIYGYLLVLILLNISFVKIALKKYFKKGSYRIATEVIAFTVLVTLALTISSYINVAYFYTLGDLGLLQIAMLKIVLFISIIILVVVSNKQLRTEYSPRHIFSLGE